MKEYNISVGSKQFALDLGALDELDALEVNEGEYHILKDGKSYHARLISADYERKVITLEVNGNPYTVKIADQLDQLVTKMGLSSGAKQKIKNVKAPMPGLVLDILVEAGQVIEKGDQLLILEAMKMENVLKAEGDGQIKSIEVLKGASVEKGHILIEME